MAQAGTMFTHKTSTVRHVHEKQTCQQANKKNKPFIYDYRQCFPSFPLRFLLSHMFISVARSISQHGPSWKLLERTAAALSRGAVSPSNPGFSRPCPCGNFLWFSAGWLSGNRRANSEASAQAAAVTSAQCLADKGCPRFLKNSAVSNSFGSLRLPPNRSKPPWTKPTGSWSVSAHSLENSLRVKKPSPQGRARARSRVSAG